MPAKKAPPKKSPFKPGTKALTSEAKRQAAESGMLPHEWLLHVMRGNAIEQKFWDIKRDKNGLEIDRKIATAVVYPEFGTRMDAAKAAAPYYAAKLATQIIAVGDATGSAFSGIDVAGLSDAELQTVKKILMTAMTRGLKPSASS